MHRWQRIAATFIVICVFGGTAFAQRPGDFLLMREGATLRFDDGNRRAFKSGASVQVLAINNGGFRVRTQEYSLVTAETAPFPTAWVSGFVPTSEAMTPETAVEHFSRWLARRPRDPAALLARSVANSAIGGQAFRKAVADAERAIEIDNRNPRSFFQLGLLYDIGGHPRDALIAYSRAIELCPACVPAICERARVYCELNRRDEAIADCNRAIDLEPSCFEALLQRGNYQRTKLDFQASLADLSKAVAAAVTKWELTRSHHFRALTHYYLHNWPEAVQDWSAALDCESEWLKPADREFTINRPSLLSGRASARAKMGDKKGAFNDLSRALELNPRCSRAYFVRGTILFNQKEYVRAIPDLDRAIELTPFKSEPYRFRGLARAETGEFDAAIEDATTSIRLAKDDWSRSDGFLVRATALQGKEEFAASERDWSRAIELRPTRALLYSSRAVVWEKLGNAANAAADRQRARELRDAE